MFRFREGWRLQNRWVFGKVQNGFWPPRPSFLENNIAFFFIFFGGVLPPPDTPQTFGHWCMCCPTRFPDGLFFLAIINPTHTIPPMFLFCSVICLGGVVAPHTTTYTKKQTFLDTAVFSVYFACVMCNVGARLWCLSDMHRDALTQPDFLYWALSCHSCPHPHTHIPLCFSL